MVALAGSDPGLVFGGNAKGLIQGRWADCDGSPTPTIRKVALADVRKSLPHVAGFDHAGAGVVLAFELGRRHRDLCEIEIVDVVIPAALKVIHEHMN